MGINFDKLFKSYICFNFFCLMVLGEIIFLIYFNDDDMFLMIYV